MKKESNAAIKGYSMNLSHHSDYICRNITSKMIGELPLFQGFPFEMTRIDMKEENGNAIIMAHFTSDDYIELQWLYKHLRYVPITGEMTGITLT